MKSKRRRDVAFTAELRTKTEQTARRLHALLAAGCHAPARAQTALPWLLAPGTVFARIAAGQPLQAYRDALYRIADG